MNVCCVLWCVVRSCRACEFKPQAGWLSARAGGLGAELPRSGSGFAEEEKRSGLVTALGRGRAEGRSFYLPVQ